MPVNQVRARMHLITRSCVFIAYSLGVLAVIGWVSDKPVLVQVKPEWVPIQLATIICVMFTAVSVLLLTVKPRYSFYFCLPPLTIGLLTLGEYVLGVDLGIDHLLYNNQIESANLYPGRMAPNTALCIILLNSAIFLHIKSQSKFSKFVQFTQATLVFCFSLSALGGYLFGIQVAYSWPGLVAMAFCTAVMFILLSVAFIYYLYSRYSSFYSEYSIFQTMLITVGGTMFFILLWQAFLANSHWKTYKKIANDVQALIHQIDYGLYNKYQFVQRFFARSNNFNFDNRYIKADARLYLQDTPSLSLLQWQYGNRIFQLTNDGFRQPEPAQVIKCSQDVVTKTNSSFVANSYTHWQPYLCFTAKQNKDSLALFDIQAVLRYALSKSPLNDAALYIKYDQMTIFSQSNGDMQQRPELWAYKQEFKLEFLGIPLFIKVWPSRAYILSDTPWLPTVSIVLGLMITFLLAFVNHLKQQIAKDNSLLLSSITSKNNKLVEMENKFKWVYEGAPDMYLFVAIDKRIMECNDTYIENMGFKSKGDVLGRDVFDVMAMQNKVLEQSIKDQLAESSFINNIELNLINENNDIRQLTLKISPFIDHKQQLIGYLFSFRDIAQLKALEGKLMAREYSENLFRENQALYDLILDKTTDGWWDVNIETRACRISPKLYHSLGYESGSFPPTINFFKEHALPEDYNAMDANLLNHLNTQGKSAFTQEMRYRHRNGSICWILCRGQGILDPDGKIRRIVGTHLDITPLKKTQAELSRKIRELNLIYNTTTVISSAGDLSGAYKDCLKAIGQAMQFDIGFVYRYNPENDLLEIDGVWQNGNTTHELIPVERRTIATGQGIAGQCWQDKKLLMLNGEQFKSLYNDPFFEKYQFNEALAFPIMLNNGVEAVFEFFACTALKFTPEPSLFELLATQISSAVERRKSHYQLQQQALYDDLTKLPNRRACIETLEMTIRNAKQNNTRVGLMFLDLDGFKEVNDHFGHQVGDLLLIEVSKQFRKAIRAQDYLARLGGDEFLIVINDIPDTSLLTLIANRLLKSLNKPLLLENKIVKVSVSIGIATFPDAGNTVAALLKQADKAMYQVKQGGKNSFHAGS
ncbi:diguanylate cyclase domain-containing protein [Legionella dresdenensis]|uniref:Diguanylate cyclase domain-containing protein n=1 Tax=Legionella dresdenensis TaxID=450200 RepID=A0ABV8CER2_9GAMM